MLGVETFAKNAKVFLRFFISNRFNGSAGIRCATFENALLQPAILQNVTETKRERRTPKPRFVRAFPQKHGFFDRVIARLAAQGITKSKATVCRTWHGEYKNPDPEIVAALRAEYECSRKIA